MSPSRSPLFTAADVAVTFAIYLLVGIALHEFAHYQVARALGYEAVAHFPSWFSGFVLILAPGPLPLLDSLLISIAGGGAVALAYVGIGAFTKDWEHDLVLGFFAVLHGVYAPLEALWLLGVLPRAVADIVPTSAAVLVAALIVARRFRL